MNQIIILVIDYLIVQEALKKIEIKFAVVEKVQTNTRAQRELRRTKNNK